MGDDDDDDVDEGMKETICDIEESPDSKEEEEDIDIYTNVHAPSTGNKSGSTLQGIAQIGNKTVSYSPEMELYDIADDNSLYGKGNDSMMSPGDINHGIYKKPSLRRDTEGSNNYQQIEQCLKLCDDTEWQKYLKNFKENKVSDYRVSGLESHDWRELIPPIGVRNEFKTLWNQCDRHKDKSLHI